MLKYKDHIFDAGPLCSCCVGDAQKVLNDPTGTGRLRRKMQATMALRWRALRVLTRDIIVKHDLLQLANAGLMPVQAPAIQMGSTKIQAFQRWFDLGMDQRVLGSDGSIMRPSITAAYMDGVTYAAKLIGNRIMSGDAQHRIDTIYQLAVIELQGIIEAVSQQAVRAVANGLLLKKSRMDIVRAIWDRIDKIGITRTNAMVDMLIVTAFNQATLDCFEAAGIKQVGLIAEAKQQLKLSDAKRKKRSTNRRTGPGSRISRKKAPSGSTIRRIAAAEEALAKLKRVNVRTAGDDEVCDICEGIAENGPYSIDRARALIPAHPRCRCAFVPAGDKRFAKDANPYHVASGEHGGEFTSGAAFGPSGKSIEELEQMLSDNQDAMEELESRSSDPDLTQAQQDDIQRQYNALDAINHVLENDIRAHEKPALAANKVFRYRPKAAIEYTIDQEQMKIDWLGSRQAGNGAKLLSGAIAHAKASGVTKIKVEAKWGSKVFYEKLGFKATGEDVSVINETIALEMDIEKRTASGGTR